MALALDSAARERGADIRPHPEGGLMTPHFYAFNPSCAPAMTGRGGNNAGTGGVVTGGTLPWCAAVFFAKYLTQQA